MFTLFNYLKNFETKITEAEIPELQFLDLEHYKNEQFNINSYVRVVITKLNDTNYLIKQLKITIENLKNEIVEQINSNFNNYIVLISKLQAIDFLIDNIEKPLQSIKKRITQEINYVEKYEEEIKDIIKYLNENLSQINVVNQVLSYYKLYNKANSIAKIIDKKYGNNLLIANILSRCQEESIFKSRNYETLRKYLVDVLRFVSYSSKLSEIKVHQDKKIYEDVKNEVAKLFINVEWILKITFEDYLKTNKQEMESTLQINIMYLVIQIYLTQNNKLIFLEKINEVGEIAKVFESSKSLPSKIEELHNTHISKFKWIEDIFIDNNYSNSDNNSNDFYLHLYIIPLVKKIQNEKIIFNCVDPIIFKENYSSLINYIGSVLKFDNFELSSENNFEQIKTFLHSFSFFTYFQYLQTEISKTFYDTFNLDEELNNLSKIPDENEIVLSKLLSNLSNLFFNFKKSLKDMFKEKKIYLKILPNFLNFILQCNNLIIIRHNDLISNHEQIVTNSNLRDLLIEYLNNLINLINYFSTETDELTTNANLFRLEINSVLNREKFMLATKDDFDSLKTKLDKLINSSYSRFNENIINQDLFKKIILIPEVKAKIKL
jgi:hypothetical protein